MNEEEIDMILKQYQPNLKKAEKTICEHIKTEFGRKR